MAFATPVRPRSGGRDMSFESHVHELLYSNQRRQFMDDQASWDPRADRPDDLASIEYAGAKFARGASSSAVGAISGRSTQPTYHSFLAINRTHSDLSRA